MKRAALAGSKAALLGLLGSTLLMSAGLTRIPTLPMGEITAAASLFLGLMNQNITITLPTALAIGGTAAPQITTTLGNAIFWTLQAAVDAANLGGSLGMNRDRIAAVLPVVTQWGHHM